MKPGTILCCGEALTDFIPRLTEEGAPAFEPKVGGSVFNTAVALGRLGVASSFLGGLSTDFFGDELRKALAAANVDISLSPVTDRYTICAFVKLEAGHARYSFIDEGSACRMLERLQRTGDAPRVDLAGDEDEIGTMIARRPSWQVLRRMNHVLRHVHDHRAGIADVQQPLYA